MINIVLWLIFGALVGWLAGIVMNSRENIWMNIVVGIVGAMIGGFLFGYQTINQNVFNLNSLLVSFVGAIILIGIVKLVQRRPFMN